ncbi:amidohydrolase family protein [Epibacterium ulvae]|uniref:amidohydrolase family protein n=1 Tax=Epibacterium ulvae TaxID=1156985 RepID=UPI0020412389|nr:amidohydrolase family protein [Epibacterium ulvae]
MVKRLMDTGKCLFEFCACYVSSQQGGPNYADGAVVALDIVAYAPDRIIGGTNFPHNMTQKTEDSLNDAALLDSVLGWLPDRDAVQKAVVSNPARLF